MSDHELPTFDQPPDKGAGSEQAPQVKRTVTDTIELGDLLATVVVTNSGSVDLRGLKQAEFGKLLQAIPIPLLIIDQSGSIVFVNKAVSKVSYNHQDVVGKPFSSLFADPRNVAQVQALLRSVFSERKPRVLKGALKMGKGRIWGRTHLRSIRVREQQLVLALVENLTSEMKRVLLNEKYKRLVDLLPIGIVEFALVSPVSSEMAHDEVLGRILRARAVDGNAEFARIHGFKSVEECFGSELRELFPYEGQNKALYNRWITRSFAICFAETSEDVGVGKVRSLETMLLGITRNTRLLSFWLAKRDITDRQNLEDETLRAQKMESIAVLAGGIAHDFNNVLTGILGNVNLAKIWTSPKETAFQRLVEAEKGIMRAKDLTGQLLTFSKGGLPVKKPCSLKSLLQESVTFASMGSKVRLQFRIPDNLALVEADEGQIGQVINNVVINAIQAMPDGGDLIVTAKNVGVTPATGLPLNDGNYVRVSVKDTGIGIPEGYLNRIFDPYFTTKQKGSGLGLATAYSIVKSHDGFITMESEPAKGSTLHIYLPVSEDDLSMRVLPSPGPFRGTGKILLMDDEEMIREVARQMLEQMGYEVSVCAEGATLIELYKRNLSLGRPYDAIIVDLTVPGGIGGREALQELLKIDPRVKAIVSTGYSNDPVVAQFSRYGFKGAVSKPYGAAELHAVLRAVLGTKFTRSSPTSNQTSR